MNTLSTCTRGYVQKFRKKKERKLAPHQNEEGAGPLIVYDVRVVFIDKLELALRIQLD